MRSAHGQRKQAQNLFNLKESNSPYFHWGLSRFTPKAAKSPPFDPSNENMCDYLYSCFFPALLISFDRIHFRVMAHTVQLSNSEEDFVICAFAGANAKFSWNMTNDKNPNPKSTHINLINPADTLQKVLDIRCNIERCEANPHLMGNKYLRRVRASCATWSDDRSGSNTLWNTEKYYDTV